ncbi:MAG: hypothetical protein ACKVQQ_10345 [Burkholderiales bacterium]
MSEFWQPQEINCWYRDESGVTQAYLQGVSFAPDDSASVAVGDEGTLFDVLGNAKAVGAGKVEFRFPRTAASLRDRRLRLEQIPR